ncbi:Crp/Fnr family transcriptional regulator [endosymbiont 'TC1' of Trimyema compressum]|uniref:Crp/Fnr family transcriptional regulator n=1 Tax=endosymbiont 'TC1' of Trimyema compressum TaxID=243899 RepID=UPI001FE099FC|nr:helix-turn-helix domain-containing protein [endosymbiont 'TC1' of Trimyema compressum]
MFLLEEIGNSDSLTIYFTHEQIAKNIGSAREVVTRTLKEFLKKGLVELHRGRVKILDVEQLQNLVNNY